MLSALATILTETESRAFIPWQQECSSNTDMLSSRLFAANKEPFRTASLAVNVGQISSRGFLVVPGTKSEIDANSTNRTRRLTRKGNEAEGDGETAS